MIVHKQPIIALYFEFDTELKFYNLEAWCLVIVVCSSSRLQFVIVVFPDHTFSMMFGLNDLNNYSHDANQACL